MSELSSHHQALFSICFASGSRSQGWLLMLQCLNTDGLVCLAAVNSWSCLCSCTRPSLLAHCVLILHEPWLILMWVSVRVSWSLEKRARTGSSEVTGTQINAVYNTHSHTTHSHYHTSHTHTHRHRLPRHILNPCDYLAFPSSQWIKLEISSLHAHMCLQCI